MEQTLDSLYQKALEEIEACSDLESLNNVRNAYLSKKSPLMALMGQMKTLSGEEKAAFGKKINEVKNEITSRLEAKKVVLEKEALKARLEKEALDITLPGVSFVKGAKNPFYIIQDEMIEVLLAERQKKAKS